MLLSDKKYWKNSDKSHLENNYQLLPSAKTDEPQFRNHWRILMKFFNRSSAFFGQWLLKNSDKSWLKTSFIKFSDQSRVLWNSWRILMRIPFRIPNIYFKQLTSTYESPNVEKYIAQPHGVSDQNIRCLNNWDHNFLHDFGM